MHIVDVDAFSNLHACAKIELCKWYVNHLLNLLHAALVLYLCNVCLLLYSGGWCKISILWHVSRVTWPAYRSLVIIVLDSSSGMLKGCLSFLMFESVRYFPVLYTRFEIRERKIQIQWNKEMVGKQFVSKLHNLKMISRHIFFRFRVWSTTQFAGVRFFLDVYLHPAIINFGWTDWRPFTSKANYFIFQKMEKSKYVRCLCQHVFA